MSSGGGGIDPSHKSRVHPSTYEYLKPTDAQVASMARVRAAAKAFNDVLEEELPDSADKTFVIRTFRTATMWANVAITRFSDGMPRSGTEPS